MPKDTPGFDFRIEPESYHQGSNKMKSRLVKVFSSNNQAAQLISILDETSVEMPWHWYFLSLEA